MEDLNTKLKDLLAGKYGILVKVQMDSNSAVPLGTSDIGTFSLHEYEDRLMLLCRSQDSYLKTSPIQSIEYIKETPENTTIGFKTWTSLYEAVINKKLTDKQD